MVSLCPLHVCPKHPILKKITLPSLGRNVNWFLEAYPDADKNMTHLIKAICQKTRKARVSKNGTPEARCSSSVSCSESELPLL